MSDAEREAFRTFAGNVIARAMLTELTISLVVVGIQFFMAVYGLILFVEAPKSMRSGRLPYIILSWVLFLLPSLSTFADVAFFFRITFNATSPANFLFRREFESDWLGLMSAVITVVVGLLGDGILLYRACVVWSDKRWVFVLPCLTYSAAVVFAVLFILPMASVPISISTTKSNLTFGSLWIFTSVAMSVLATSLLAYRLIQARRQFALLGISAEQDNGTRAMYTGVLAILIESAMPLTLFGIGYAVILAITERGDADVVQKEAANYVVSALYYAFTALSPQMIIFRVTTGRSWMGSIRRSQTSPDIMFARSSNDTGGIYGSDSKIENGSGEQIPHSDARFTL